MPDVIAGPLIQIASSYLRLINISCDNNTHVSASKLYVFQHTLYTVQ